MSREDVVRKIIACLNLGESPNLHEAQAAIVTARRLMAKHKITERELAGVRLYKDEVVTLDTSLVTTNGRKAWIQWLAGTIADAFGCEIYMVHARRGSRNYGVTLVGEKHDVDVANKVLHSAYTACNANLLSLGKLSRDEELSYGSGFNKGVASAIKEQDEEDSSLALVMSTPQTVVDFMRDLELGNPKTVRADLDDELHGSGYRDGVGHIRKKIEGVRF